MTRDLLRHKEQTAFSGATQRSAGWLGRSYLCWVLVEIGNSVCNRRLVNKRRHADDPLMQQTVLRQGLYNVLSTLWAQFQCLRGKHVPDRNRVRREGMYFMGRCKTCSISIRRRKGGMTWKRFPS